MAMENGDLGLDTPLQTMFDLRHSSLEEPEMLKVTLKEISQLGIFSNRMGLSGPGSDRHCYKEIPVITPATTTAALSLSGESLVEEGPGSFDSRPNCKKKPIVL